MIAGARILFESLRQSSHCPEMKHSMPTENNRKPMAQTLNRGAQDPRCAYEATLLNKAGSRTKPHIRHNPNSTSELMKIMSSDCRGMNICY